MYKDTGREFFLRKKSRNWWVILTLPLPTTIGALRTGTCFSGKDLLSEGSPISCAHKDNGRRPLHHRSGIYGGTETTKEAVWIKSLLEHICNRPIRCVVHGDNQGSLALATDPVFHQRTKHIDIRQKFISEMVNNGTITVQYVPTKDMIADGFTKPLSKDVHFAHCKELHLIKLVENSDILIRTATNEVRTVKYYTWFNIRIAGMTTNIKFYVIRHPTVIFAISGKVVVSGEVGEGCTGA